MEKISGQHETGKNYWGGFIESPWQQKEKEGDNRKTGLEHTTSKEKRRFP